MCRYMQIGAVCVLSACVGPVGPAGPKGEQGFQGTWGGDAPALVALLNGALADGGSSLQEVPISGATAEKLTGVVTMTIDSPEVAGIGTQFSSELRPSDAVRIGANVYTVTGIDDSTSPAHLYISPNGLENLTSVEAFRDRALLRVQNGAGASRFLVDRSGLVALRTEAVRQSLMSFGESLTSPPCSQNPAGHPYGRSCRTDVLSIWESQTDEWAKHGLGMHPYTLELYTPTDGYVQVGSREVGGGFTPKFTFSNSGDGWMRVGPVTTENTREKWGTPLYFSGATSYPGPWDSENSDPLSIARYNVDLNATELRVRVGDDPTGGDSFVVGTLTGDTWTGNFLVGSDGNYWFRGANISTRSSKRDIAPFDESALDILDEVQLVTFAYKDDPQGRPRRVGIIADDPQHRYDSRLTNGGTGFDVNTAAAMLIKAMQEQKQLIGEQQRLLEKQRAEIAALRAIVCRDKPKEALCH